MSYASRGYPRQKNQKKGKNPQGDFCRGRTSILAPEHGANLAAKRNYDFRGFLLSPRIKGPMDP